MAKDKRRAASRAPALAVSPAAPGPDMRGRFPLVGIGASAGGLEALELFFSRVPASTGMAFVVVQHLDPTQKGFMPELLQRFTPLPVAQVRDRMRVKPDSVSVIPPNKDLSILNGVLHLLAPVAPRGQRLPIDFFFRALARDQQEMAAGVVLSGMGSDGTLGLRAIKEAAGVTLVQSPSTAKFEAMPRSAVEAGLADFVLPAEEIASALAGYHRNVPRRVGEAAEPRSQGNLEKIVLLLRAHTGHDFSLYKKTTLARRVERRMGIHKIDRLPSYIRYLQENPQERGLLFRELLIGVTSFFRDPEAWELLGTKVLPGLLEERRVGHVLRAWIPGCSTGEDAYSLAILFREAAERTKPLGRTSLQLFATDIDPDAIDRARQGSYPVNIEADVSPERLRRFFVEEDGRYRVGKEIRESVVFATQNLISDPPFTKLDLVICRNLLIYFEPELQKRVVSLFHYSLSPGGVLFLGSAESLGTHLDLFSVREGKAKIYRRADQGPAGAPGVFPAVYSAARPRPPEEPREVRSAESLQQQAEKVLLSLFSPAAVLVNAGGDIVFINGKTGRYLEPAAGKADWNLFAMARDGLRYDLTNAFRKVVRTGGAAQVRQARIATDGGERAVEVSLQVLEEPPALRGMVMVVFRDEGPAAPVPARVRAGMGSRQKAQLGELEGALQQAREELQSNREEMQTSQEELKSSNEELQSTNEELQSTNEELTTSKEELQSLNEELQTVNAELMTKVADLSRANNDMKNLLNSTDIATVFLDGSLHVRRFTTQATKIIQLILGDVGRPITDIASSLVYPSLTMDAREVLRTLVFSEKVVDSAGGRRYRVRIMPYRTVDDMIDGVVITFTDVTLPGGGGESSRGESGKAERA